MRLIGMEITLQAYAYSPFSWVWVGVNGRAGGSGRAGGNGKAGSNGRAGGNGSAGCFFRASANGSSSLQHSVSLQTLTCFRWVVHLNGNSGAGQA